MDASRRNDSRARTLLTVGLVAGALAGIAMAIWQMVVGAVADEPTAVAGIDSSLWTPVTGVASFYLGLETFSSSFDLGPVLFGVVAHMVHAMALGALGVALLVAMLGVRASALAAIAGGIVYGLVVQVVLLSVVVNGIQDVDSVYTSTPEWSWWAAHALYGIVLGAVAAALLARRRSGGEGPGESATVVGPVAEPGSRERARLD